MFEGNPSLLLPLKVSTMSTEEEEEWGGLMETAASDKAAILSNVKQSGLIRTGAKQDQHSLFLKLKMFADLLLDL